jgi:transcriptional regulator with XRE-family HTH domain
MSYGYSVRLIETNAQADASLIGVRLGKECIRRGISVYETARRFGVSKQTVYNWFCGATAPHKKLVQDVEEALATLLRT